MARQIGCFDAANGGTIFLDVIGELPPETQAKLLSVLQEWQFDRLGGTDTISADVRVITATNRDLESEVREGDFRQDLLFRLGVCPITIPPLRDHPQDGAAVILGMNPSTLQSRMAKLGIKRPSRNP